MNQHLVHCKSAFIKDGELWCVPLTANWLLKINLNNWIAEKVCNLELDEKFWIEDICQYEDYVLCVTRIGVRVISYHISSGEIEHFKLAEEDERRNRGTVLFDNKLWILPIELPGKMISFDPVEKKFQIHDKWEKECLKWKITGRAVSFCQIENIVYMTLRDECKLIQFDLKKETIKIKRLPGKKGLWCVFAAEDKIYITSFAKRVLFQWDKKEGTINKIYCPYMQDMPYGRGMGFGNKILLMDNKTIDIYDPETGKILPYHDAQKEVEDSGGSLYSEKLFFKAIVYGEKYFLIPWGAEVLLEFSEKQKEWTSHKIKIPEDVFQKYILKKMCLNHSNFEGEFLVKDFINYVKAVPSEQKQLTENKIGYEIYKQTQVS